MARAAAARGTAMGLSSFASKPVEEVVAANPQTFFQMYWMGGKDDMLARMERARAAGAVGLIVTLDWSFSHGRDWGSPSIPEKMDLKTMLKFAPEGVRAAAVAARLRPRRRAAGPDRAQPGRGLDARADLLRRLRRVDDDRRRRPGRTSPGCASSGAGRSCSRASAGSTTRRRAVDAGVTAISVSNHGGNNLDGTPAPIRALPAVAEAVGDEVEVLLDGGIRRGSDVVKALALGARAVMIGRAYLWGLAANGQAGVENVLDILRGGIDSALLGLGHSSIHDLGPDDVLAPDGFFRALGT